MAKLNIFKAAGEVSAKPTAAKKRAKLEVPMNDIANLAKIKAMMDSLEAAKATLEQSIKTAGFEKFLEISGSVRPESFKGIDGVGSASVEMRKRGTNSALNADEVAALEAMGLKPFEQVITTEMYGINPKYAADETLMEKVSEAIGSFVPEDFIVLQAGVKKNVVDDGLVNSVFAMSANDPNRRSAIKMVTTMALKPKLSADYDFTQLAADVQALIKPVTDDEAEEA